jgi:RNA polymerase sigma-70 factor (ECF subfamily)
MNRVAISFQFCFNSHLLQRSLAENTVTHMDDAGKDSADRRTLDAALEELSDEEILEILYSDFSSYLYSLIKAKFKSYRLPDDEIDDCFMEIIIKISEKGCRRIRQFKGESSFKTYLTVLCRNLITDYIRKELKNRKRIKLVESFTDEPETYRKLNERPVENPEAQYLQKERNKNVHKVWRTIEQEIERLPHGEKLIAKLRFKKNMTYREIDSFLGIENGRYQLSKIVQKIRDSLSTEMKQLIEEIFADDGPVEL